MTMFGKLHASVVMIKVAKEVITNYCAYLRYYLHDYNY